MTVRRRAKTILIIENEADIQKFFSRVLELEGYRVLAAADGDGGLALLRGNAVSLVLLDLRLPGRDGWSVLHEIREDAALSKVPVVVITAVAETPQRRRTLRMGADKYITKPVSAHNLAQAVASALSRGRRCRPRQSRTDVTD
jgi:DNA-binding response OmpR family regulator